MLCDGRHSCGTSQAVILGLKIAAVRFSGVGMAKQKTNLFDYSAGRHISRLSLKGCAVLAVVALLLTSVFACVCHATTASEVCCALKRKSGSLPAASISSAQFGCHACCGAHQQSGGGKLQCCLRNERPNSPTILTDRIDCREVASDSDWQPPTFDDAQPAGIARTTPVMNRGSTYIECCVLRI
jgi:hypothetical protein